MIVPCFIWVLGRLPPRIVLKAILFSVTALSIMLFSAIQRWDSLALVILPSFILEVVTALVTILNSLTELD